MIAFAGGGALDTVTPGVTGELFPVQTVESLLDVLCGFDWRRYQPEDCRNQAARFSTEEFRQKLMGYLAEMV